jgi:ankyrin repeat protein
MRGISESRLDKQTKFNLKQLMGRSGSINMGALEKLLDTTDISAVDVETNQTLLEYACRTNNISLAKLCYRRGAPLHCYTPTGETPFNIATKNKCYKLMECLRMYGVKVNSADRDGQTALHIATTRSDLDSICRLIEWGADINSRDNHLRTPLHYAAISGDMGTTMFLLELGADLNAMDDKECTAVAHAEGNDHFKLMDRLVMLGGRGHRMAGTAVAAPINGGEEGGEVTLKGKIPLGEVKISPLYLKKNSSLGRIGKYHSIS